MFEQRIRIMPNGDVVREPIEPVFKAYDMTDPVQAKIALEEDIRAILNDPKRVDSKA